MTIKGEKFILTEKERVKGLRVVCASKMPGEQIRLGAIRRSRSWERLLRGYTGFFAVKRIGSVWDRGLVANVGRGISLDDIIINTSGRYYYRYPLPSFLYRAVCRRSFVQVPPRTENTNKIVYIILSFALLRGVCDQPRLSSIIRYTREGDRIAK